MTISATCPKGHTLTLEEKLAGKKIRCPRCQTVFEVPQIDDAGDDDEAVSEKTLRKPRRRDEDDDDDDDRPRGKARRPVDDDEDDDDDRPRKKARAPVRDDDDDEEEEMDDETRRKLEKQEKKKKFKLVDIGLLLHVIKLYVTFVGILCGATVVVVQLFEVANITEKSDEYQAKLKQAQDEAAKQGKELPVEVRGEDIPKVGVYDLDVLMLFFLNLFVGLIGPLCGLTGSLLCCWIPKKSEARGSAIVALICDLVCIVVWLLWVLAIGNVLGMQASKVRNMVKLLYGAIALCVVVAWLMILTYQRALGKYLGDARLGNEGLNRIVGLAIQVVLLVVMIILNVAGATLMGIPVGVIVGCAALGAWVLFFIFFFFLRMLKLFAAMRAAIQRKM